MLLVYLILAHLLADFIFQPTKLVLWKIESKKGVFVHVLIHFLTTSLILLPFIILGNYWILIVAFVIAFFHFWIDQTKISYDLKHDNKVVPFIIDQLLHLLTILLCYFFTQDLPLAIPETAFYSIYSNIQIIIFLISIIFVSTVIEIYYFQKQREKNKNARLKINPDRMLTRVITLTLIYILFISLSFYARGRGAL